MSHNLCDFRQVEHITLIRSFQFELQPQKFDFKNMRWYGIVNGFKQCHWYNKSYKRCEMQLIFIESKAIKIWMSFWSSSLCLLVLERFQLTILVGIDLEIMWINWDKNTKMHIFITLKCSDILANMTNAHIENFCNSFEVNISRLLTIASWHLVSFTVGQRFKTVCSI